MNEHGTEADNVPLCVSLDRPLLRTDLPIESWFGLLRSRALRAILAPLILAAFAVRASSLRSGRARAAVLTALVALVLPTGPNNIPRFLEMVRAIG
jgi:hypothetical protein